ncbi:unannotated protein [freshwater metagenome]|uniref:Unannotated protein n=1 Tax=freshwater metagenome TaxID=449393 RepID=A0A6J7HRL2_9ZZZZ
MVLDLPLDSLDEPRPHRVGSDEQPCVLGVQRIPGQDVEQVRNIVSDHRIAGEEAEVLVEPRGLRVVVAGTDVAVAAQLVTVISDDHGKLAVRLQPDKAVDDVNPGLLELAAPVDVVLLIESRFDLDNREDLLAVLGRIDEGIDDR